MNYMDMPKLTAKDAEYMCNVESGIRTCVNVKSGNPFEEVKRYGIIKKEHTSDMDMNMINSCRVQSISCFSTTINKAYQFAIIFLLAMLIVSFLHELCHFFFCIIYNIPISGFLINIQGGISYIDLDDIGAVSPDGIYFIIMGPILLVNTVILIVSILIYKPRKYTNYFESHKMSIFNQFPEILLKSMGYFSAMVIFTNTLLSPIIESIQFLNGIAFKSDFMIAWNIANQLADPIGFRILLMISITFEISIAIFYLIIYGRKSID